MIRKRWTKVATLVGGNAYAFKFLQAVAMREPASPREVLRADMIRQVRALRTYQPTGSEHYRSGWDTALDAVIDLLEEATE